MSDCGFFQGTQAQRGYDDAESVEKTKSSILQKLQGLKYDPSSQSSSQRDEIIVSQSNKFSEKVKNAKKTRRRKLITGSSDDSTARKERKLRKFDTVTKEVLRRFREDREGSAHYGEEEDEFEDGFGLLINEEDWNSNQSEVISSVSGGDLDDKERKKLIMREVLNMNNKSAEVEPDLNILRDVKDTKDPKDVDIDDLVKESPFYNHQMGNNDPKKYFNSNSRISQHNDDVVYTLEQARALYDTSLNISLGSSFFGSQISETESAVLKSSGDSVVEIGDSYVEDDNDMELVCAQGTQNDPIELEGSSKLDVGSIIEIPNTSDEEEDNSKDIHLNDTIIEIDNSTDEEDNDGSGNNNEILIPTSSPIRGTPIKARVVDFIESPLKQVAMRYPTLIEVPSSEPASPVHQIYDEQASDDGIIMSYNDREFNDECSDSDSSEVVEIGPSQTQADDDEDSQQGDVLNDLEKLLQNWSKELLAKQMNEWGLKPEKSKAAMIRKLMNMANGISPLKLGFAIESHTANEIIAFNENAPDSPEDTANVRNTIRNEIIENLLNDDEIRESISIYRPLELDKVYDKVKGKWSGVSLNKQWFSNLLDELGVCWTPRVDVKMNESALIYIEKDL